MTRTYTTRHGAGPLTGESTPLYVTGKKFGEGSFVDPTNVPNPWQGTLRFAPIDVYSISDRILIDKSRNWNLLVNMDHKVNVCITCMDQTDSVKLIPNIYKHQIDTKVSELPKFFKDARLNVSHFSYGPTAKDVVTYD